MAEPIRLIFYGKIRRMRMFWIADIGLLGRNLHTETIHGKRPETINRGGRSPVMRRLSANSEIDSFCHGHSLGKSAGAQTSIPG